MQAYVNIFMITAEILVHSLVDFNVSVLLLTVNFVMTLSMLHV